MGPPRRPPVLLALGVLVLLAASASAEVCKGSKVPEAELRRYDATATLSQQEAETAFATFPGANRRLR